MIFADKLIKEIKWKKSHVVVGLDPVFELFPDHLRKHAKSLKDVGISIYRFNQKLIDSIYDLVPAVKPQIAFYERYGLPGLEAFYKTVQYAKKKGLIIIEDAKRNDIGSTAVAYSDAHIGKVRIGKKLFPVFDVDALTVNAYLGSDGVLPFIKNVQRFNKGIFILVKTSNKSSFELQDIIVKYKRKEVHLYEILANYVNIWSKDLIGKSGYSSIGVVVGATFPIEARKLRKLLPHSYFLVPGFGAQGGKAEEMVNFFNKDGLGALISSSRAINYAYLNEPIISHNRFALASRKAVQRMNEEINFVLGKNKLLAW